MDRQEQLAHILAVVRAQNHKISQPERTMMIMFDGVEAAFNRFFGDTLFDGEEALESARTEVHNWYNQGVNVVSIVDPEYPKSLATVHEAPALLFYEGDLRQEDEGIAIVGSRDITAEQISITRVVTQHVASRGLSVVSGLAKGVDTAAHQEALRVNARTVAIMGTPLETTYPQSNVALRQKICESGGLVLSQFLPGSNAGKYTFPMRNKTMSGYAQCTIIIAAAEESGTRHQAFAAHGHGRPLILLRDVVESATWAKELSDRPGVFVVSGSEDLEKTLTHLEHNRNLLGLARG